MIYDCGDDLKATALGSAFCQTAIFARWPPSANPAKQSLRLKTSRLMFLPVQILKDIVTFNNAFKYNNMLNENRCINRHEHS